MKNRKLENLTVALLGFLLGIAVYASAPYIARNVLRNTDSHQTEEIRLTSPNAKLDAVMVLDSHGGAAGGLEWLVYIVPKGTKPTDDSHALFRASKLSGEKLAWSQAHLLEIHYDVAEIESFRNLWGLYEVQNVGPTGERDFEVEIRLVPSSPDFSILTPAGRFR